MASNPETSVAAPASSPVEAEVLRIKALMQASRNGDALEAALALIARVPENRDLLYMIAVNQRYTWRCVRQGRRWKPICRRSTSTRRCRPHGRRCAFCFAPAANWTIRRTPPAMWPS
jgi:hypothetical protein